MLYKVTSAHEEGGERVYSVSTTHFEGDEDGNVQWLHLVEVEFKDGKLDARSRAPSARSPPSWSPWPWASPAPTRSNGLVEQFGLELDERGNIARDADFATNVAGVFVAGDAGPRPVADRLGHRRGPLGRPRRGPLPDRAPAPCRPRSARRTAR